MAATRGLHRDPFHIGGGCTRHYIYDSIASVILPCYLVSYTGRDHSLYFKYEA